MNQPEFQSSGEDAPSNDVADDYDPQRGTPLERDVKKLPSRKVFAHKSKASACHEVLKEISSLTYLVYDAKHLETLLHGLIDLRNDLKAYARAEEGLILEESTTRNVVSSNNRQKLDSSRDGSRSKNAPEIPKRKSRKRFLTGRVGEAANRIRQAKILKIDEDVKVEATVVEEHDLLSMIADDVSDQKDNSITPNPASSNDMSLNFTRLGDGSSLLRQVITTKYGKGTSTISNNQTNVGKRCLQLSKTLPP